MTITPTFTFDEGVRRVRAGVLTPSAAADRLIEQLTDRELLWLLDGDYPLRAILMLPRAMKRGAIVGGAIGRLGIPGVRFSDGPRGVIVGRSTAFPVTMARGATWDPELEERVGLAMGLEARAHGANYSGAVCINLLRHPAWGRAQECYGEDPVLTGRMGGGLIQGLQRNVMACVKHFALNSMENARFRVDVNADDHALHEVYLPHFKTAINAGADSVMSSYNSVNGHFAAENSVLLTDILRDEWGFDGFVTSDWAGGTHDAIESLEAGMDVEMPFRMLRARELPAAARSGRLPKHLVLRSAKRILTTLVKRAALRDIAEPSPDVVASETHRGLAREVAVRGAVLLKNEPVNGTPVLPLDPAIRRLAVIGRLATEANTGDRGSSLVNPPTTSSPLDGLREALPGVDIVHVDGTDIAAATAAAAHADAAIVVAGMSFDDEGERIQNERPDENSPDLFGFPLNTRPARWLLSEIGKRVPNQFGRGGDRASLTLHTPDEQLILAVAASNLRTVVTMIGGSAILVEAWQPRVPAILMAWYPGMEGGRAIADLLTGAEEPGGRLPFAIATDPDHYPYFDAEADSITYDSWWGQRMLDRDGHRAAYPFGYGLGYTTFEVELEQHATTDTHGIASVRVRNTGGRIGSTVAQLYAVDIEAARAVPQLIGFRRVELEPGAEAIVDVALDLTPTRQRDPGTRTWSRRPGTWHVLAAQHSPTSNDGAQPLG